MMGLHKESYKCLLCNGVTCPRNIRNDCQLKLCHLVRDIGFFQEICSNKLYIVTLIGDEDGTAFCQRVTTPESPFIFWTPNHKTFLRYDSFDKDFGPYSLANTHQFCSRLKLWLDTQPYRNPDKHVVIVLNSKEPKKLLNVTLLVCIAAMVVLKMTDEDVMERLRAIYSHSTSRPQYLRTKYISFSDVSGMISSMDLRIEHCIKAFHLAMVNKFYDYYQFDPIEYFLYETVDCGDLNWIVPGKLIAFAGPHPHNHPPEFYYHYFKHHNIDTIIRLNNPEYQSSGFVDHGFQHYDLIFPDGCAPTMTIARRFIKIVDAAEGAVAVHCYAGIGRTGTLIAAYLMVKYGFTPETSVAWTRICRPGSVIGPQQDWLMMFPDMYNSICSSIKLSSSPELNKTQMRFVTNTKATITTQSTYSQAEKKFGQAKALVMIKKRRDNNSQQQEQEQHSSNDNSFDVNSSIHVAIEEKPEVCNLDDSTRQSPTFLRSGLSRSCASKSDFILDLGKSIPFNLTREQVKKLNPSKRQPNYYKLKEGKYIWKVKYPKLDFVEFVHHPCLDAFLKEEDLYETLNEANLEYVLRDDNLAAKKSAQQQNMQRNGLKVVPKLRPIAYFAAVVPI